MSQPQAEPRYHTLVAVGDREQLRPLLAVGCTLARVRDGAVTLLCVMPDGARPASLVAPEPPAASAVEPRSDVPVNVLVRPGRDAGATILATVRADLPDLLLGWRGSPGQGRYLLGSTLDPVIRYAPCDVAVVHANDDPDEPSGQGLVESLGHVRRVLAPAAGGTGAHGDPHHPARSIRATDPHAHAGYVICHASHFPSIPDIQRKEHT